MCSLSARSALSSPSRRARLSALVLVIPLLAAGWLGGADRASAASSASPWWGYLWPASGLTCGYAPASDYSTPVASYAVTSRSARKVAVRVRASGLRAKQVFAPASGGRMKVRVVSLASQGVTLRMGSGITYPALSSVTKRRSVTSAVTVTVALPAAQAAQVKPYLTSGSAVKLQVTFRVKGLGKRTVQGYRGAAVSLSAPKIATLNVASPARSTVISAARQYLAPLLGTQVYAASYGLVSFGGTKASGADGLLLTGCS